MIIPDRKKAVTMILSKLHDKPEEPGVEMKNEGTTVAADEPLMAISRDAIRAFKNDSPLELMNALKAFFSQADVDRSQEG